MPSRLMEKKLREASQLTGIFWSVWLEYSGEWKVIASYNLASEQRLLLLEYIRTRKFLSRLRQSLTAGRSNMRIAPLEGFAGEQIYLFSDPMTQRVILIGCNPLPDITRRLWQTVVQGSSSRSFLATETDLGENRDEYRIPYYLPQALDQILGLIMKSANSKSGWLAIRSGDYLETKSLINCENFLEDRVPVESNPMLRDMVQTMQGRQVAKGSGDWPMVPQMGLSTAYRYWIGMPLLIGQRLIGLIALWRESEMDEENWIRLIQLVGQMAPSVEASITFSDLSNHLHRLALLNDFAVTISSALDPEQIAQRMFALLQRAFSTERIDLMIYTLDGRNYQHFSEMAGAIEVKIKPMGEIPILWPSGRGDGFRVEEIMPDSTFQPINPDSKSSIIIPLKYRHQVIGILSLESAHRSAFSIYDEHLLDVIASHLSGLLENGRLRRDAEEKARNLSLIHDVVERVIGLADIYQVGRIAAKLIAQNFAYELTVIVLTEGEDPSTLRVAGIGGSAAGPIRESLQRLDSGRMGGIVSKVALTGQNLLVNDVTKDPIYRPIPNWEAGSEMCVALKEGESVLGVIDVESRRKNAFSRNDLFVLESLAGILASVFSNAGQYQKLQATIDQLSVARQELQERIAAQRMTESRLVQAAKLAAVGEMAAGIAHELNNPLTTVSGFTELVLQETPLDDASRTDLELVLREAHRARTVVRRLLDFARQSESRRTKSDLNETINDVLTLVKHLLHTSGIEVTLNLAKSLPWVMIDRNQIKQVVLNLIHNALHAMPEGGELRITTCRRRREKNDGILLSVSDSGHGIPAEYLDRIFEPFFTTRSNDGGTGLGLSVSYGIIADHGGFIDVDSQVGKGSSFEVWLPVKEE